ILYWAKRGSEAGATALPGSPTTSSRGGVGTDGDAAVAAVCMGGCPGARAVCAGGKGGRRPRQARRPLRFPRCCVDPPLRPTPGNDASLKCSRILSVRRNLQYLVVNVRP